MLRCRFLVAPALVALLVGSACLGYDIRTEVPPITPDRWLYPPLDLPTPALITRDDYLEFINRNLAGQFAYYRAHMGEPDVGYQDLAARREAFLYRITGEEIYAQRALGFIRGHYAWLTVGGGADQRVGFNVICPALETYLWIKDSPSLRPADHEFIHSWFNLMEDRNAGYEVGAMNRSMGWATGRMILTRLYPNDPRNPERIAYAQQVWNDWYQYRDTDENAEGYNAIWLTYLVFWLEAMGQEDLYYDPAIRRLFYRFLHQASPLGVMPYYGDECGWNNAPGRWIALLEKWATVYGDGRFRWVAHRMFEYTAAQETQMWQWGNINIDTADALMNAYLAANDSLPPRRPDNIGSVLTTRREAHLCTREERQATGYFLWLLPNTIPNKLIFRDGWRPYSTFAQIELCPPYGHGHSDAGGIDCFISQGSVLLTDTPYLVKDHSFHNCFVVKRHPPPETERWDQWTLVQMRTTVHGLRLFPDAGYARVRITTYMGQPVTLDRRLWFFGAAGMWVQDRVQSTTPYTAKIGPAWQTLAMYGVSGPNWVNTCYQSLPVAYIWEEKYMMQWDNRAYDLLLYFIGPPGSSLQVDDVTKDDTRGIVDQTLMNNSKLRVWCQKIATLTPGQPVRFSTLLLPHPPTPNAQNLVSRIHVLRNTDDCQVIRLPGGTGQTLWAGINDRGRRLSVGDVATDATQFLIKKGPGDKLRWYVCNGSYLTFQGTRLLQGTLRTTTYGGP